MHQVNAQRGHGVKMLITKHGCERRRGVSSRFALGKMDGEAIVQSVSLFAILACFVVDVSASVLRCRNQSKSNRIKPNPTKSNHYFFWEQLGPFQPLRPARDADAPKSYSNRVLIVQEQYGVMS